MTVPSRMIAIAIRAPGGPEMLVPEERPVPAPGPGEILVKVAAAGVNRPDVRQRQGTYPPPRGATDIPGLEMAGEVAALGPDVKRWKIGDKVCALVVGGGYAQYCLAYEPHALPVPPALSMAEAAAMPETFFTCWQNMFMRADVKSGDWVLVHGGTSGIGTTAIMLAKAFGGKVITTAGSADKCAAAQKLGADVAVNYKTQDFVAVTKEATGGLFHRRPQGHRQFCQVDAEAPAAHRLDAPPAHRRREGRDGARHRGAGLAAGRRRPDQAGDRLHVPAGQGVRRPRPHGDQPAHRQDRVDGVAAGRPERHLNDGNPCSCGPAKLLIIGPCEGA